MKRIVHAKTPGGSIPGRPLPNGKPAILKLKVGRNEIDQVDLDVALATKHVKDLIRTGRLVLEPVPAVEQPPVPATVPKAAKKAEPPASDKGDEKAPKVK